MATKLDASQRTRAGWIGAGLLLTGDVSAARPVIRAAFTGQWEGYESDRRRNRPGQRFGSQDTDLNFGIRERISSEARALEQTFPLAANIKKQYADYCVGQCNIRWNTGEKSIDALYRKAWNNWKNICDYKGEHRFPELMKIAVGMSFAEGAIFAQQVLSNNQAMINLIEADRVSSHGLFNSDTDSMVAGIGIDPQTRRKKFIRVWTRTIYGTFAESVEIPASEFKHLYKSMRADAVTGVSAYHAVLNSLRDLKEISDAERIKTKRHAKLAIIEKRITGSAPPIDLTGNGVAKDDTGATIETMLDGTTRYIFPNESVEAHESNSPNENWQEHMKFIIRNIAIGAGLPFGVVWSMAGLNKPAVLFELRQAERSISAFQDVLEDRFIRPLAGWWLSVEIKNKRLPFNANWTNFKIGRPPYISIDAGRDSTAAINENKAGMRSLASWYDETDDFWEDEIEQCAKERAFLEEICAKYGVDPSNVRLLTPNGNPAGETQKDPNSGEAE